MGSRSLDKSNAAVKEPESRNLPGSVEVVPMDITNDNAIARAASTVDRDHGKLDTLVNNTGIGFLIPPLRQQMREAFDTNAIGPAVVTSAFAPLLQTSTPSLRTPEYISSGAGSVQSPPQSFLADVQNSGDTVSGRARLRSAWSLRACGSSVGPLGIKVFAYDPGFTQSDLRTPEQGGEWRETGFGGCGAVDCCSWRVDGMMRLACFCIIRGFILGRRVTDAALVQLYFLYTTATVVYLPHLNTITGPETLERSRPILGKIDRQQRRCCDNGCQHR